MKPRPRTYATLVLAAVGLYLVTVGALNYLVDPLGVYRDLRTGPLVAERARVAATRTARAAALEHRQAATVVLGTSRVAWGIDEESPFFPPGDACCLGLPGANYCEIFHAVNYAAAQPGVKRLVIVADFFQFSSRFQTRDDFEKSAFQPGVARLEYHAEKLFSHRATRQSFGVLADWLDGREDVQSESALGQVDTEIMSPLENVRDKVEMTLAIYIRSHDLYGGFQYAADRMAMLGSSAATARQQNLELIVAVAPVHALQLEAIRAAGLWEVFETWKRDLTLTVAQANPQAAVWDFSGYGAYQTEPVPAAGDPRRMQWYRESAHFSKPLGDKLLARVFQHPQAESSFGARLTPESVDLHLAHIRSQRACWLTQQADEVEWVNAIARRELSEELRIARGLTDTQRR